MKFSILLLALSALVACIGSKKVLKEPSQIVAPFDGTQFDNIEPFPDKSVFDVMLWQLKALFVRKSWPEKVAQELFKPEVMRSNELKISVINHATTLIQIDGVNILTDPQFSERSSPLSWAGPKRVIDPGIPFGELPPIDVVVVSHDHYDHLDLPSLKRISERWGAKMFVGLGNKPLLEEHQIGNVIEMDWWESVDFDAVKIQFVPVQHWSARSATDRRTTLWGGFVIHGTKRVFFAGDTGYGKVFKMIQERVGSMDLSLIPIGAYEPRDFMKHAHVSPAESVKIFLDTNSKKAVGIHFGTFADLTDEYIDQPAIDLKKALKLSDISEDQFIVPEFGRTYSF